LWECRGRLRCRAGLSRSLNRKSKKGKKGKKGKKDKKDADGIETSGPRT